MATMRTRQVIAAGAGVAWLSASLLAQSWTLPRGTAVKEHGPRT